MSTYIERDVRQIRSIPDLRSFNQFLNLAATRHGQEFHAADLAREQGISQPTVKSWAGVLEASYIAHFLQPWFRNYGKRVVKSPKFYFHDSALVTLLTRQPDATAALAGPMGGRRLEGWVVTEAVKAFMALGRKPDAHYWRSHDGLEVDLLLVIDGKLQAVEVKLTATPGRRPRRSAQPLPRHCRRRSCVAGHHRLPHGQTEGHAQRPHRDAMEILSRVVAGEARQTGAALMPASLEGQLVVALSSRALFDFEEKNRVFEDQTRHCEPASRLVPTGHVVSGVANSE